MNKSASGVSSGKGPKKRKTSKCSSCWKYLNVDSPDHKANSKNCPCLSSNWRHQSIADWVSYLEGKYGNAGDKILESANQCVQTDHSDLDVFWAVNRLREGGHTQDDNNKMLQWGSLLAAQNTNSSFIFQPSGTIISSNDVTV